MKKSPAIWIGYAALGAVLGLSLNTSAAAAPFAYVANPQMDTVQVIDIATNTLTATVPVKSPFGAAVTPDGRHVYITCHGGGHISVLDTSSNREVARVPVETGSLLGIAITPDGKHAYVAHAPGAVLVVDTASNKLVASIPVAIRENPLPSPFGVAIARKHAYVAESSAVAVLDTSTNTVVERISVGSETKGIAITPDAKFAYVTHILPDVVSVIDTTDNTVVIRIPMASEGASTPFGIAITPDGKHAYVAHAFSDAVSVLDTATNTVSARIPVNTQGGHPFGVAIAEKRAYLTSGGHVAVLDTATKAQLGVVGNTFPSAGIAITPNSK